MLFRRRNVVTPSDFRLIAVVMVASAVAAAWSGASPTGGAVVDVVLLAALGAAIPWCGATAPWWILFGAAFVARLANGDEPVLLAVLALFAAAVALGLGLLSVSRSPVRALVAALVVQVLLRVDGGRFFGWTAVVSGVVLFAIVFTGVGRRPGYVRRRVAWGVAGLAGAVVLLAAGAAWAAVTTRTPAVEGYRAMLVGLDQLQDGQLAEAGDTLRGAARDFEDARRALDRPWSQGGLVLPVVAQNQRAMSELLARGAAAASTSADTLAQIDLDRLAIRNGRVDVEAVRDLIEPMSELEATVNDLQRALAEVDTPWLLGPIDDRLARTRARADQVQVLAANTAEALRVAPAMLGADGPRRYLLAFTNPGEARGSSGLIGNWTELTITNGRIRETESGRTGNLITDTENRPQPLLIEASEDFFVRYGRFGAGEPDTNARPKLWSNVTMTPDWPSAADVIRQMYAQVVGRELDGVFLIDPAGVAALLSVTGPVEVPELGVSLSADNAEQFLLVDQYEREEADREEVLEAVTNAMIDRLLEGDLPGPQVLARSLAPAALGGNLTVWAARPDEQTMLAHVGVEGALPVLDEWGSHDGLAVVAQNLGANKIDSFLQRTITYRPTVDEATGRVEAVLEVVLENDAPASGLDDYVIGNLLDLPKGTNYTAVEVFTPLTIRSVRVDGEEVDWLTSRELGWTVYSRWVEVPPGGTSTVTIELWGELAPGPYELVVRPQALPRRDRVVVEAVDPAGRPIVSFDGQPTRRIVLSAEGERAWR